MEIGMKNRKDSRRASQLVAGTVLVTACAGSASAADNDTAITIYSTAQPGGIPAEYYRPLPGQGVPAAGGIPGYAMVRQDRKVELKNGRTQLRFTDVAALIDPTTVQFASLTDPDDTRVLEQNYQFDLVSTDKLLSKYVDRNVVAQQALGNQVTETSGTLLSSVDGLVLRGADGQIHALRQYSNLRFPELPGGLITQPTLLWDIAAKKAGAHTARVSYQTGGMTWWADYNVTFNEGATPNAGLLDLSAWVSIINQSGASFDDAKLKLIAGDVQRAQPAPGVSRIGKRSLFFAAAGAISGCGFVRNGRPLAAASGSRVRCRVVRWNDLEAGFAQATQQVIAQHRAACRQLFVLEHRQRLAELHRAALELAEGAEELLGGALLHLRQHRIGGFSAEPLAEPERRTAGIAHRQRGQPCRARDGLARQVGHGSSVPSGW